MKTIKRFENYFDGGITDYKQKVIKSFDDAILHIGSGSELGSKYSDNINKMDELENGGDYTLEIDGEDICSLSDFIQDNTGSDVEALSDDDINRVSNLEIGEEHKIGIGGGYSVVKRIA